MSILFNDIYNNELKLDFAIVLSKRNNTHTHTHIYIYIYIYIVQLEGN